MRLWSIATLLSLCAGLLWVGIANAQPPGPGQPPPGVQPPGAAKPPAAQPKQPPPLMRPDAERGLPPGHPPITTPPGQPGQPGKQPGDREMLDRLRQLKERAQDRARQVEGKPAEQRFPRDEHGHCLGQGPNDRPPDINLLHGWLGSNNEEAVQPPKPKGSWEWWQWRLTPYPFRYQNKSDACDPRNQPVPLVANVVNLGVLVFFLVRFGRKPLRESLEKRRARIMAEVDRAREIMKSAKTRLMRYEDELDHLDDKLTALRAQYQLEGEAEERRLLVELAETRERMLADAEFRIAQESKQARDDLSREALDSALGAAEELLQSSISTADHQRLCDEYLEHIGTALRAKPVFGGRGGAT